MPCFTGVGGLCRGKQNVKIRGSEGERLKSQAPADED